MRTGFPAILVLVAVTLASAAAAPAATAVCEPARYEILGSVIDPGGEPVAGASVYLLVDKVKKKEFLLNMVRAEIVTTDEAGRFRGEIDCQGHFLRGDFPRPCSRGAREITVGVRTADGRTTVRTFKFKGLVRPGNPAGCRVQVPAFRLSR